MSDHEQADSPDATQISRRDLFFGAGMTAGAIAAIGGLAHAPAAQAALSKSRQYFATHVLMELDSVSAGRVSSAEGGEPFLNHTVGDFGQRTSQIAYQPLTVQLGDMSPALYDWIGKATVGTATPRAVNVITLTSDAKEIYRLTMQNVRLSEVQLDTLSSSSTEAARFTVKMTPGTSAHQFGKGGSGILPSAKVSPIISSNFRLYIQGVEAATTRARSIDPVGMRIVPTSTGSGSLPVPMTLRFSVPFVEAGLLFTWMQDTLAGKGGLRQGELQLLSRDLSKVVASVGFSQLMITRISCPAESSSGGIQHAEVECAPAAVTFNMGELLK